MWLSTQKATEKEHIMPDVKGALTFILYFSAAICLAAGLAVTAWQKFSEAEQGGVGVGKIMGFGVAAVCLGVAAVIVQNTNFIYG
jgi:hypothetical protein